jgi:hypothetical protein
MGAERNIRIITHTYNAVTLLFNSIMSYYPLAVFNFVRGVGNEKY